MTIHIESHHGQGEKTQGEYQEVEHVGAREHAAQQGIVVADQRQRMGDIANAVMVVPNLLALMLLSGVVFALSRGDKTAGKTFTAETPEEPEEY